MKGIKNFSHRENKTKIWVLSINNQRGDAVMIDGKFYLIDVIVDEQPQLGKWIKGDNYGNYYYLIYDILLSENDLWIVKAKEIGHTEWRQQQLEKLL